MAETDTRKFKVIADMREQRSGVTLQLERSVKLAVEYADLPVGDYVLSDEVVIERKEATDFVNSIMDRRIFGQVAQMNATYARPVVIIEGDVFDTRSLINPDALRGAISWLSVLEGVSVLYTRDAMETAAMIEIMARHAQEGLGYEVPLRAAKPKDMKVLARYCVEGIPGIGATGCRNLLEHFGSIEKVFTAKADELCQVKGVGKKTAEQIREVLLFDYNK